MGWSKGAKRKTQRMQDGSAGDIRRFELRRRAQLSRRSPGTACDVAPAVCSYWGFLSAFLIRQPFSWRFPASGGTEVRRLVPWSDVWLVNKLHTVQAFRWNPAPDCPFMPGSGIRATPQTLAAPISPHLVPKPPRIPQTSWPRETGSAGHPSQTQAMEERGRVDFGTLYHDFGCFHRSRTGGAAWQLHFTRKEDDSPPPLNSHCKYIMRVRSATDGPGDLPSLLKSCPLARFHIPCFEHYRTS